MKSHIIACLPAFNEEKFVGSVVLKARQYVDRVIVVDDGSTDNTAKVATLAGAEVIKHGTNKGNGAAIQTIFAEARKIDPDILVVLDADGQHDPLKIPCLIRPILENDFDCVIGTRHGQVDKIPLYRRIGQRIILHSVKAIYKNDLTDTECGFRAFSRKAIQVVNIKERGMAAAAETCAELSLKHLKVTQVPINVSYHKVKPTINPIKHGLSVFNRILVMIADHRPMLYFGVSGAISFIVGVGFGIRVIDMFEKNHVLPTGNTLLSATLMIIGTLSIFCGLILRAISREKNK